MVNISYVDHGLGNNYGEIIELNKHLQEDKWKNLHKAILDHELKHTNATFTKQDFIADMTESKASKIDIVKFMFQNPKSFTQFLPFYYEKKWGFVYDINLIIFYLIFGVSIGFTFWLANRF